MFVLITIVSSFSSSNSVLKVSFSAHASIGLQVPARHRKPVAGDSFLLVCTSDDFWAIPSYTAVAPSCSNRALLWRFCPDMHPSHGLGQQPTDRPTVTLHLSGKKILFSHSSDRIVKPPFSSHFTRHFRNKYSIKRAGIIIIFFFLHRRIPGTVLLLVLHTASFVYSITGCHWDNYFILYLRIVVNFQGNRFK